MEGMGIEVQSFRTNGPNGHVHVAASKCHVYVAGGKGVCKPDAVVADYRNNAGADHRRM